MRTDWSSTSYSELATLAHCDEKWWLRYVLEEEVDQGKAAKLGDALHAATADVLTPNHKDLATATIDAIEALDATGKEQASYLLPRWWDVMRLVQPDLGVAVENEMKLEAALPNGVLFKGRLDTLHQNDAGLITLRECKSSGRKTNLDLVMVAPQLTLYYWLLCENGIVPDRVLLDHINTYHYKSARHVSETAQLVWVDRHESQIDEALGWAMKLIERRDAILQDGDNSIRNFGAHCSFCDHKLSCFEAMNFGRES